MFLVHRRLWCFNDDSVLSFPYAGTWLVQNNDYGGSQQFTVEQLRKILDLIR